MKKTKITITVFWGFIAAVVLVILFNGRIYDAIKLNSICQHIKMQQDVDSAYISLYLQKIPQNILTQYIVNLQNEKEQEAMIAECAYNKKNGMIPFLKQIGKKKKLNFCCVCAIVALEENIALPKEELNSTTPHYNQMSDYYRYLKKVLWAWDGKSKLELLAREIAKNWKASISNSECEKLNGPLKPLAP